MPCSKIIFASRAEAKAYGRSKGWHGARCRPYKCSHPTAHDGELVWHLTSQSKKESRSIARKAVTQPVRAVPEGGWRPPAVCGCERPLPMRDEGDVRCLACGKAAA